MIGFVTKVSKRNRSRKTTQGKEETQYTEPRRNAAQSTPIVDQRLKQTEPQSQQQQQQSPAVELSGNEFEVWNVLLEPKKLAEWDSALARGLPAPRAVTMSDKLLCR